MDQLSLFDLIKANTNDSIEEFFTKDQLEKMCDYEKSRYRKIRQNYEMLKSVGLPATKPEFMQRKKKHKPEQCTGDVTDEASEAETEPEWLPKHKTPGRYVLKPLVQSAENRSAKTPAKMRKRKDKVSTCAHKDSDEEPHVYEFRKRKEINYMHVEIPDDDEFLYCEECHLDYPDDCPVHRPLDVVFDTVVPADECDPDRALHTLPAGLEVRQSGIPNAGLGVWASAFFPVRSRFGPYDGRRVTAPDVAHSSGYCWEIYTEGQRSHFVDAKDCSVSNWMRYVNCACTSTEQNLTAYQHRGQIFYRSHCDIQSESVSILSHPGTELLVWYGPDYGQELGITRDKACRSSRRLGPADGVFPCPHCRLAFSDSKFLERHTNRRHGHLRQVNKTQVAQMDKNRSAAFNTLSCHLKEDRLSSKKKRHKDSETDDVCDRSETRGEPLTDRDSLDSHTTTDFERLSHINQKFGKSFTYQRKLNADRNTQTGEQGYRRETCTDSINFKRHMPSDTGKRPFTWKSRGKTFTRSGDLSRHIRTHTGERPYTCKTCNKTFTQSGSLKTHIRTHTGERPYTCKTCNKTFIDSGSLKTHMHTHTQENDPIHVRHVIRHLQIVVASKHTWARTQENDPTHVRHVIRHLHEN